MLLSSSRSVAFTLAIISPTRFFSSHINKHSEEMVYKIWWSKDVANANVYAHTCLALITCKESFGFGIVLSSLCQEFEFQR